MTPETDENGSDSGAPRNSPALPTTPAAKGRNDALWAGFATTVVPVALGLLVGIGYLGYANVQRQIKAQHAELESLRDKISAAHSRTDVEQSQPSTNEIQGFQNHVVPAAQSRTDVEQSQPSMNELQGLLNHVETLRGQAKRQKK